MGCFDLCGQLLEGCLPVRAGLGECPRGSGLGTTAGGAAPIAVDSGLDRRLLLGRRSPRDIKIFVLAVVQLQIGLVDSGQQFHALHDLKQRIQVFAIPAVGKAGAIAAPADEAFVPLPQIDRQLVSVAVTSLSDRFGTVARICLDPDPVAMRQR